MQEVREAPPLVELLTVADVARVLGLATRTVRHLIADGHLPSVRPVPRSVRVHPADLVVCPREVVDALKRREASESAVGSEAIVEVER